ncbi:hypothetical protein [Bacillus piscicola]|uniref:hypothetical protein n=1 Tax=Bacillus piscicola TaxID=1632684 RepID=UPI001F092947|nr:hypothetical protein [Bacillus piscicola]
MNLESYAKQQILRLWYDKPQPEKSDVAARQARIAALLRDFKAKGVTQSDELGGDCRPLDRWTMTHPKLWRKGIQAELINIITDYLLDVGQVAEREAEYPIPNAEKDWRDTAARQKYERTILLDEDMQQDDEWPIPVPYSADEYELDHAESRPVEEAVFWEDDASDPASLIALIDDAKQDPRKYARRFAGARGNEREVRVKIRRLDTDRVRRCECCGGAFYAHDLRQRYCDLLPMYKQPEFSQCSYKMNLKNNRKPLINREKPAI